MNVDFRSALQGARIRKAHRERLRGLKHEASPLKHKLIRLAQDVRELSPREADRLEKIIARLEAWQNR